MKTPITFQVASTKPFGEGKFLNFTANGPQGQFEGIAWEQSDHNRFYPGAQLTVQVGAAKADGAFWNDYKGKRRLEISKGAEFAAGAPQTAPQTAPVTNYQPATATAPAPSYTAPAPSGGKGEEILTRAADLVAFYRDRLAERGFSPASAEQIAGSAPEVCAQWWFGERHA